MDPNHIRININPSVHEKCMKFYETYTPIFAIGESISGMVMLFLNNGESIKHRGITVSLIASIWNQNNCVETNTISSSILVQPSTLSSSYSSMFTFNLSPKLQGSYNGSKYSLKYQIVVTIKRFFGGITQSKDVFIIKPVPSEIMHPSRLLTLTNDSIHIDFKFSDIIFTDKVSTFRFQCIRSLEENVKSIILCLKKKEIYKDIIHEVNILEYEVCDGNPRSGAQFNVYLDPRPYKMWPAPKVYDLKFEVKYSIKVLIKYDKSVLESRTIPVDIAQLNDK